MENQKEDITSLNRLKETEEEFGIVGAIDDIVNDNESFLLYLLILQKYAISISVGQTNYAFIDFGRCPLKQGGVIT